MPESRASEPQLNTALKCFFGTLSSVVSGTIVYPLEVIKIRMQISGMGQLNKEYTSTWHCAKEILEKEGAKKLFAGIDAAICRQSIYTTARLALYFYLCEHYRKRLQRPPPLATTASFGMISGVVGAFLSNPADFLIVRVAADGKAGTEPSKNYKSSMDAVKQIYHDEGPRVFFRGAYSGIKRAALVNFVQFYSYAKFVNWFYQQPLPVKKESRVFYVLASLGSGLVTALVSAPLDLAKTRVQKTRMSTGDPLYTSIYDALYLVSRHEGFFAMWKGLTAYVLRIVPHSIMTFGLLEYMSWMYRQLKHRSTNA